MKILLAYITISNIYTEKKKQTWEPLGLAYLASYLRKHNYEVEIFYPALYAWNKSDIERYFREIKDSYDFMGLSISAFNISESQQVIEIIRSSGFDKPIILGGLGPTCQWQKFSKLDVDCVVIGEGEKTLLDIAKAIESNQDIHSVQGISFVNKTGELVRNGKVEVFQNLDDNVFPARDVSIKLAETYGFENVNIQIQTSRGCYGKCSFCSMNDFIINQEGLRYRSRTAKNVVDEIRILKDKYHFVQFDFMDESFFPAQKELALKKAEEFFDEIKKHQLKVRLFLQCQLYIISKEMLDMLSDVGVEQIFVGVDGFTDKSLQLFNKPYTREDVLSFIKIVKSSKYRFSVSSKFRIKTGVINFTPLSTLSELYDSGQIIKKNQFSAKKISNKLKVFSDQSKLATKILEEYPGFDESNYFKDEKVADVYNNLTKAKVAYLERRDKVRSLEEIISNAKHRWDPSVLFISGLRKRYDNQFLRYYFQIIRKRIKNQVLNPCTDRFIRRIKKVNPISNSIFMHLKQKYDCEMKHPQFDTHTR